MVEDARRYAFPLATFHVCVLVVAFIVVSYPDLGGLGGLNTLLGLGVFGVLWGASYYGTSWALADPRVDAFDVAVRRGILGGARAGLLVVVGVVIPLTLTTVVFDPLAALFVAGFYGGIGAVIGAVAGGAVGFVFSLVDWALLATAGLHEAAPTPEEARHA